MQVPTYILIWSIWTGVFIMAITFTLRFSQGDTASWKVIKFFGVAISTMPIVGIVQGLAIKSKSPNYAQACLLQAGVGIVAYLIIQAILK
jgi:hypothetical protein